MTNVASPQRTAVRVSAIGMLRRRAVVGVLALALGVGGGLLVASSLSAVYRSTTSVLVTPTGLPAASFSDALPHTEPVLNLETESQVAVSQAVAADAARRAGDRRPIETVLRDVKATVPPNTTVLEITVTGAEPAPVQKLSHSFAEAYLAARAAGARAAVDADIAALRTQLGGLQKQLETVSSQIARSSESSPEHAYAQAQQRILIDQVSAASDSLNRLTASEIDGGSILADASVPQTSGLPLRAIAVAGGVLLGLVVGLAAMLWLERRDRTVRAVEDVEVASGLPILGAAARRGSHSRHETRGMIDIWAAMRNDIESTLPEGKSVLLVVPLGSSEGCAHAVASLSAAFGRTGTKVAVVCADLDSALLPQALGISPAASGVTDALSNGSPVTPSRGNAAGVFVLPPGRSSLVTRDMLHSRHFAELVHRLRDSFDLVVVQALPADSVAVARVCDATALIVETGRSRWDDVEAVTWQLRRAGARLIGASVLDTKRLSADLGGTRATGWSRLRGSQDPGGNGNDPAVEPAGEPSGPIPPGLTRGYTLLPRTDLATSRSGTSPTGSGDAEDARARPAGEPPRAGGDDGDPDAGRSSQAAGSPRPAGS